MIRSVALGFLAFVILWPKVSLLSIEGSSIGIRIEDVVIACVALYLVYDMVINKTYRQAIHDRFHRLWSVWILWALVASLMGYWIFHTVDHVSVAFFHLLRYVEFWVVFAFAKHIVWKSSSHKISYILYGTLAFELFYIVLQVLGVVPYFSTLQSLNITGEATFESIGVVMGTFSGHYDFGAFVVLLLIFVISSLYMSWSHEHFRVFRRVIRPVLVSVALVAALVLTRSRSAYLAALGALSGFGWYAQKRILVVGALIVTVVLGGLFVNGRLGNSPVAFEVGDLSLIIDKGSVERMEKWSAVFTDVSFAELWIGRGLSSLGEAVDGYYIRLLGEVGVIGLGIWLYFIMGFVHALKREIVITRERGAIALTMFLFSIGLLVQATFIDIFASSKIMFVYWFVVGVVLSSFAPGLQAQE